MLFEDDVFKMGIPLEEISGLESADNLKKTLNDEEKIIFEKFAECTNEMYGIAEREAFIQGFSLGAKIIIEVLSADRV